MVSSTFTVSNNTTLSFTGTTDPNNFATTATFEYREVGGTYADGNTTTTSLGNGVDGAVGFSLTKTVTDGFKHWEARAKGTNVAGTGLGAVLSRDCTKSPIINWNATVADNPVVGTCNNRTYTQTTTYTRDGCPTWTFTTAPIALPADCGDACYDPVSTNPCDGCGSITTTNPKPGSNCPGTTTGSCGTWYDSGGLGVFLGTVSLVSGSYPYATYYSSTGNWYYTDAAGNLCNCGCPSGRFIAPGWVDICDQGGYRSSGTDRCIA
jgi:hypothetical protein